MIPRIIRLPQNHSFFLFGARGVGKTTWIKNFLPTYTRSLRKRQRAHPKFYLFDTGVSRALAGQLNIPLAPGSAEYGRCFEQFWVSEIIRLACYKKLDWRFSYFATYNLEIDLVIEKPQGETLFVEFKSSPRVKDVSLRNLIRLSWEDKAYRGLCISCEPHRRKVSDVLVVPWQEAIEVLGLGVRQAG